MDTDEIRARLSGIASHMRLLVPLSDGEYLGFEVSFGIGEDRMRLLDQVGGKRNKSFYPDTDSVIEGCRIVIDGVEFRAQGNSRAQTGIDRQEYTEKIGREARIAELSAEIERLRSE